MAPPSTDPAIATTADEKSTDVSLEELQAQLATIIAERDAALEENSKLRNQFATASGRDEKTCLFLERLPIEIRRAIYALLLTNDVLSEWRSMDHHRATFGVQNPPQAVSAFDYTANYELSPALLRACRQIYVEGCEVLYGSNTFIVDCAMNNYCYSPIFRTFNGDGVAAKYSYAWYPMEKRVICAVKKVQRWKIFLSCDNQECPDPILQNLRGLCEAIRDTSPKTIQVLIVPQGTMFQISHGWFGVRTPAYHTIELVLQPLQILRNVSQFDVRNANIDEVRNFDPTANLSSIQPLTIPPAFENKLKRLVQGSETFVSISKMYHNLLAYAQSFELQPRTREAMRPVYGAYRASYQHNDGLNELSEGRDAEEIGDFVLKSLDTSHPRQRVYDHRNSKFFSRHPLELSLSLAAAGCELNDLKMFKRARVSVLDLLEPQYQKILTASRNFAELVKYLKVPKRLFDADITKFFNNRAFLRSNHSAWALRT